jgi:tetratricopeptide (TPR) repeat protein
MGSDDWVAQWLALSEGEAREQFLAAHAGPLDDEMAQALKDRATRLLRSDVQRSLEVTRLLLRLAEEGGNPLHRALGLLAEANACSIGGLGEYQRAVALYDEAADIYRAHGCPVEEAKTQIGKLYSLAFLGRYTEAVEVGRWAGEVLAAHEQWRLLVNLTLNLAVVHGRQRADAEALAQFDRARALCERLGREGRPTLQLVEQNRAVVLRNLGRFDQSIQASRAAGALAESLGHRGELARVKETLAYTYLLLGRYNEALALLDEARDIFLADGRTSEATDAELVTSTCLLQLRRFEEVLETCRRLRARFAEQGTRREAADATLNEALAHAGLQQHAEALASLDEAREIFQQEANPVRVAGVDLETASVRYRLGEHKASLAAAQACAEVFRGNDLPVLEAEANLVAARSANAMERHGEADRLVRQALALGEDKDLPALTYQCRRVLGAQAEARGDRRKAAAEYDRAIEALERLRGRLMVEFRAGFLEDKQAVYEDMVCMCLDLGQPERGLAYAERAKSRALIDMLAAGLELCIEPRNEGDRRLVDELTTLKAERDRLYRRWQVQAGAAVHGWAGGNGGDAQQQAEILALEKRITDLWHRLLVHNADYARDAGLWQVQVDPPQPYLDADTLLLEYFSTREELVAFLVTAGGVQARRLPADPGRVQRLLQLLWLNLRSVPRSSPDRMASLTANVRALLQQLHGALVAPFAEALADYSRLVVVPHGPLHYLPFHALHDGRAYLLERHVINYLPGSSLLRYCQGARHGDGELLAVGHSFGGALPHAVEEAQAVAAMLGGRVVVEQEATPTRLELWAAGCRVLHLATHGDFRPDNPLFSGLALAGGWLTTLDIFRLRLEASLVTLSACQTGRSVVGGGDELLGLMRAFLYAGAASLVLTLWAVEDRSTAELMASFYGQLAHGWGKGAALRQAQLAFALGQWAGDGREAKAYTHPYFWAPFYLVGDAGPL